jgi:hypothetical protein
MIDGTPTTVSVVRFRARLPRAAALIAAAGFAISAHAAPVVSSVSGELDHKGTVTISGSGFGSKSRAAPVIWDDMSTGNVLDKWDLATPNTNAAYNLVYRSPQRGISLPHQHATRYLAGAHGGSGPNGGAQVMAWKRRAMTSYPQYSYVAWYQRSDDNWVFGGDDNYKVFDFTRGFGGYDLPYNWYIEYNERPTSRTSTPAWHILDDVGASGGSLNGPASEWWFAKAVNPMAGQWTKIELEIKYTNQNDGFIYLYENGVRKIDYQGPTDRYSGTDRSEGIGGYARQYNQSNNWRYFSDIYLDYSLARVVLSNNANLGSSTIIEPQVPSQWSGNSISFTVNLGKFKTGDRAYVHVVDSAGVRTSSGLAVTVGGGGELRPSPVSISVN